MNNDAQNGSNVLVWGALGFLGQHLVEELLRRGAKVAVLCRPRHLYRSPRWAKEVTWYELTGVDDAAVLLSAVCSANLIYNFAGASGAVASNLDPEHSLTANCAAQLAFLHVCEQAGHCPHVVFASSWLVYSTGGSQAVNEGHALAPRSTYAAHKLCIENYLRIWQLRGKITYTICRISNPYGADSSTPTKSYKILNSFLRSVLAGEPVYLFGDGGQLRDFLYISDLTEAFLLCACPEARNETFNISQGVSHSLVEVVTMMEELVGSVQLIYKPWPVEYEAAEPGSYVADVGKAATRLGFHAKTPLRTGLQETVHELRTGNDEGTPLRAGAYA